jgi:hypothetical protein
LLQELESPSPFWLSPQVLSPMAENPATLIESGFASRASTHKSKTSRKASQKFDSCSLHSLGQLPKRADESESVGSRFAT